MRKVWGNQESNQESGLVYSTDGGRMCPACRQPLAGCTCAQGRAQALADARAQAPAGDSTVRVSRETAGRKGKGKGVTLVRGLPLADAELADLGRRLKALCGSGGTVKDGVIEVQGDHRERVVEFLQKAGWTVKRAGG